MTTIEKYIEPFMEEMKSGVVKLVYDIHSTRLQNELEKCKADMERYKKELEQLKNEYQNSTSLKENIQLKIEEKEQMDVDDGFTSENIANTEIKIVTYKILETEEESEEEEEENEEDVVYD